MKVLIVGAGLYGSVCARELTDAGHQCLVIECKPNIGGHCQSIYVPQVGCHVHLYGPHIFHTSNEAVWRYINRFASFNAFVNRPKVRYKDKLFSFPINLLTMHQVFGVTSPQQAREVIDRERHRIDNPANMEEWCLANIGPTLYRTFIEGYTRKQWRKHPKELPSSIIKRIPVRFSCDDRYSSDTWQGIPVGGYSAMFKRLLDGIPVECSVDYLRDKEGLSRGFDLVIYTGAIDEFCGYCFGALEYRSLRFEIMVTGEADFQGNAVVNYTEFEVPYTRIIEHKHFEFVDSQSTVLSWEYPDDWRPGKDQFYPVNTPDNQAKLMRYRAMLKERSNLWLGGRLAEYRYLDMHEVIASALDAVREISRCKTC
jgi:UDP-galactopyranose mutase